MIRLHFIVEGQTEELFVKNVLSFHFAPFGIVVDAGLVTTRKDRQHGRKYKGGLGRNYAKTKREIENWLKSDSTTEVRFTTMFDFYALPEDFPGFEEARRQALPRDKAECIEVALRRDIADDRFIPHIQLHEFEALLLSAPERFIDRYPESPKEVEALCRECEAFETPEDINEGETTAPSKRISKHLPAYASRKTSDGPTIAERIGLDVLRDRCPHFNDWITRLEQLAESAL